MPVVAVTREYGSGATAIAMKVAHCLNYEYIRDQITKEAAEAYGVDEDELIAVVESKRGFWDSLAEETQVEFALVASEVYRLAEQDNLVIVGRWATLLLRSIQHCIRVRVCAPMETRIPRVMARRSLDREEAVKLIRKADEGASSRIRQFFDVQWGDPLLYDLVINTERVSPDLAVQQILELARHPDFQLTEASRAKLRDRSLEARIRGALKADRETMRLDLTIVCESGHVALKGLVFSSVAKEAAERLAKSVDGIREVDNQIRVNRE